MQFHPTEGSKEGFFKEKEIGSVYLEWHCGQKYPPRDSWAPLLLSRCLEDHNGVSSVRLGDRRVQQNRSTYDMLNEGLASWSVREAMMC
ncbi:hypothetical protein EYF80_051537 [Liparis tanakae]|uniref:Uncharacterized protein n=1 Tax=Liparis tanakae TaxID=230148 RepID=A0A4Z2FBP8_9TELE|nr:hypothetical protein EYF80_051537 [Liparis tanakae]